jgi:hypothetical protein
MAFFVLCELKERIVAYQAGSATCYYFLVFS